MVILDDIQALKKIDTQNMLSLLKDFPQQIKGAQDIGEKVNPASTYSKIDNIVFVGMGGSAIGADLLRCLLYKECKLPINVIRSYEIPSYVSKNSLVFMCSYSGNTEETISCFKEAKQKTEKIISISSGGILEKLCKKVGILFVRIPVGYPPRCALGYLSIVPLVILSKLNLINSKKKEIEETIVLLSKLYQEELAEELPFDKNKAKKLAQQLQDKYVIIYASSPYLEAAVVRFRGQLAENAKQLSSVHTLPEMNHNEIVGWQNPRGVFSNLTVVFMRNKKEHLRLERRVEITESIIKKEKVEAINIYSSGVSLLARIFSLVYVGDFTSFYLAILNNTDPTAVDKILYLKEELSRL